MKPSEIIDKVLTDYLPDEAHWTQRNYGVDDKVCIMGGIGMVAENSVVLYDAGMTSEVKVLLSDLRNRVAELTNKPRVLTFDPEGAIIMYNDAPNRTYDEVRELLEKSRAGLQEKGQ